MRHKGLLLAKHGCCGCFNNAAPIKTLISLRLLILKRIVEATATIRQQLGIFECIRQCLLRRGRRWESARLCIEVGACTFEHLVSIANKLHNFFFQNT